MKQWSTPVLCGILFAPILLIWVPARWPLSILEVGSFLLALAWVIKLSWSEERPRLSPVLAPFGFVFTWGTFQLALHWTVAPPETTRSLLNWAAYLAIVFVALQTFNDPEQLGRFLRWLMIFGFALCVVSTLQTFTSPAKVFWYFPIQNPVFLMGPFPNHAHYAALMELVLPLALLPALNNPAKRFQYCLIAGALVASVVASASRAGSVLIAAEMVTLITLWAREHRRGPRRMAAVLGAVLLLTAGLTAIVGWENLTRRFLVADPSRVDMLKSSLVMIREHAWVGVGLGNWPTVYPSYARYDDGLFTNQAHNDWAQWAAEGGLPMLAALLYLALWTLSKSPRNLWCLGPVFVFLHACIDYPFQKPPIAALVFALVGAAAARRVGGKPRIDTY